MKYFWLDPKLTMLCFEWTTWCLILKIYLKNITCRARLTLICIKWVSGDPSTIFLATIFTQKMTESSGPMYPSTLMLEDVWYYHFTWSGPNSQEIVNLFQFSLGPKRPAVGAKFTISCEFGPLQVKWWCHMFSNIK